MKYNQVASLRLLEALHNPQDYNHTATALRQLLELSGGRIDNMPPRTYCQLMRTLTSGSYACLVEDIDAATAPSASPLVLLGKMIERVMPMARILQASDIETVAARLFQRLKERHVSLRWRMVHPIVSRRTDCLSHTMLEDSFLLQNAMGRSRYAHYPVVFTLDTPLACVVQHLYYDAQRGVRQVTLLWVVPSGLLRLTVSPRYMLGYEGHDGLLWMQQGFRVRIGGLGMPVSLGPVVGELLWLLTDYRWERRVACHPVTGVVVEHNARLLTR